MKSKSSLVKSLWLLLLILLIMSGGGLPLPLLLILIAIVFLAPLVREFRRDTDLDERQVVISHFSSHIAFYVMLILIILVMVKDFIMEGETPAPWLYLLLIIPLLTKVTISLYQNYNPLKVAFWIGYAWFGVWFLFILFSHGLSTDMLIEVSPFLLFLILILISRRKTLLSALLFLAFAIGLTIFFRFWNKLDLYVQLLMLFLIPIPLMISGIVLLWNSLKLRRSK